MNGHVCASIVPGTQRERALLAEVRKRGLLLHKLHATGSAVRLTGPGVWLTASALGSISLSDLEPVRDDAEVRRIAYASKRAAPRRPAATV